MPEGSTTVPISVRLPVELLDRLDRVAAILERPRSWVILDAVREYLADQGQEVLDIQAGIDELDRGEGIPLDQVLAEMEEKIAAAEAKRTER